MQIEQAFKRKEDFFGFLVVRVRCALVKCRARKPSRICIAVRFAKSRVAKERLTVLESRFLLVYLPFIFVLPTCHQCFMMTYCVST